MDWVTKAAESLRDFLGQQSWLDAWQPVLAATPDWALIATGPGFVLLLALLLWAQIPRGKIAVQHAEPNTSKPGPQARAETIGVPAMAATGSARQIFQPAATTTPSVRGQPTSSAAQTEAAASAPVRRASGVPDDNEEERKARVFLSSTFRDMRAEREVLATDTFPALRRKFRARGVAVQEVDLRWGVNESDATLDICLQAVRRSNWFVGLLGQRYGTTLQDEATVALLGPDFPAVREGLGRSLTEIEILEGVLLNAKDDKETIFFERDAVWLDTLSPSERPEYEDQGADAQTKLADLKTRIRERVGIVHAYAAPQEIDAAFEKTISEALERAFPPIEGTDDPFMQEHRLHAAFARERLGLYVGGDDYLNQLDAWMAQDDAPPKIAVGASGGGKSTLIAHWTARWARSHRNDIVFAHYLGASPDSANPAALIRRLWLHLNRITGDDIAIPSPDTDLDDLREQVSDRLAQAVAFAAREKCFILIAFDGLDKLSEEHRDLRWWPLVLPPRIKLLASSLDGKARDAARERNWSELVVHPFGAFQQSAFIAETLKGWDKSDFPEARKRRVLSHALAGLPLFLRTILEELRVSAANDVLDARLDDYLEAPDMPDLYARILAQIEHECGKDFVAQALSLIWASRAGLEEDEIVAIISETQRMALGPAGLAWERLRNRLADNLRDSQGRVAFSHDYLGQAVKARFLATDDARRETHLVIADHFEQRDPDERQAEELPYQLERAEAWERLEALLVDLERFASLRARGDGELLSYWLPLKARGRDPETLLCGSFKARAGEAEHWSQAEIDFAYELDGFLRFAGARGDAIQRLGERLSAACERLLGPEHPDTLTTMNNLSGTLYTRGDLEGAQRNQERVLEARTRLLGPEHPSTLASMGNLASTLKARGDLDGAQRFEERVLEAMTRLLGPEHPYTLTSMNNLAGTLSARGDVEGAQRNQERVLEARTRLLGPEHPSTLTSMNNLAGTLYARGDLEGALKRAEHVLAVATRRFGGEHPLSKDASDWVVEIKGEIEKRTEH
jgi:nephrocystin-3